MEHKKRKRKTVYRGNYFLCIYKRGNKFACKLYFAV